MTGDLRCAEPRRRAELFRFRQDTGIDLNGIDRVEIAPGDHKRLHVHFVAPLPEDAYGLEDVSRIRIEGGTRVVGIRAQSASRQPDGHLDVEVNRAGDFSPYVLSLEAPQLDPALSRIEFSFMATCPSDLDCGAEVECPPDPADEPALDYMAKDYASFRRLMLDLLPKLDPDWEERNPADLGIALVELLAYVGDQISYFQDAAANEAYLDTARRRVSVRRHARLIDYRMHDGRNAWTWVHVRANGAHELPPRTKLATGIADPLAGEVAPPGPGVEARRLTQAALDDDPALAGGAVFETAHRKALSPLDNLLLIHTFGDEDCCLAPGTTEAYVFALEGEGDERTAVRPTVGPDDFLLLEEILDPRSGAAANADPSHRAVVRIEAVDADVTDALYSNRLVWRPQEGAAVERRRARQVAPAEPPRESGWVLQRRTSEAYPLPLVRVRWRREDALGFPLCVSASGEEGAIRQVSVARGNMVLADHGVTVVQPLGEADRARAGDSFRLRLPAAPVTMTCPPEPPGARGARRPDERHSLVCSPRDAVPAVRLVVRRPGEDEELWTPVRDLLDSGPFDRHFVVEVGDEGRAELRFGDGDYGRSAPAWDLAQQPVDLVPYEAVYRVGNGRTGNVAADAIAHLGVPEGDEGTWLGGVRNPLPARDGADPEPIEDVREHAPEAFRAEQRRAVTEDDYAAVAADVDSVSGAVASFRWTGSWYTAFVGVDPRDDSGLEIDPEGRTRLAPSLEAEVRDALDRYRLAGYDVELRPPAFVPLELDIEVCAAPGHFRPDVRQAVARALVGSPVGGRAFFHPEHFGFGQPVYLSRIYAAVERVPGVDSLSVRRFRRYGQLDRGELDAGVVEIGPWEVARLAGDPNLPEHGVLRLDVIGGKA